MEYKRFVAKNFEEAKKKMIMTLGINAYILKRNDIVKSKFFGLKKERFVEIQAGILDNLAYKKTNHYLPFKSQENLIKTNKKINSNDFLQEMLEGYENREKDLFNKTYFQERSKKLSQLQEMIAVKKENFGRQKKESNFILNQDEFLEKKESIKKEKKDNLLDTIQVKKSNVFNFLIERDFSKKFAFEISQKMDLNDVSFKENKKKLASFISHQYEYMRDVKIYSANPNILFFVGPTGVGKTTTLAKIASRLYVKESKSIVMATFDIRRIMATAQLEKYAHIMGVPFSVLYEKDELQKLVKKYINKQLIFIDTAGTSQHDKLHLEELSDFVNFLGYPKEVYLCLNASFRYNDLLKIVDPFSNTNFDRLLITKTDESYSLGSVLSMAYELKVPLSFLTNGQDVPNDILLLEASLLEELLLKEWI